MEDWKSHTVRQRIVNQFQEIIRQIPEGSKHTAEEIEATLFNKSKKKEDYQQFVTRILTHLKDQAKVPTQNPSINTPTLTAMLQVPTGSSNQISEPRGGQITIGTGSGNRILPTSTIQGQINHSQHLTHGNTSGGQIIHGNLTGNMGGGGMMVGSPVMQQQNSNMTQSGMAGGIAMQNDIVSWQNHQKNQRATEMMITMNPKRAGMNSGPVMGNMSVNSTTDQMGQITVAGQIRPSMQPRVPSPGYPSAQLPRQNVAPTNVGGLQSHAHVSHNSISFMSPSPSSNVPSPVGGRGLNQLGTPSPGGMINTPGQPISQLPSPATSNDTDEKVYTEKVKLMRDKYLGPLAAAIQRFANSDKEKAKRLKNLLDVLENPERRGSTLENLKQCENLLERVFHRSTATEISKQPARENPASTFLDAINFALKSPHGQHTIHRTLAPAMKSLLGPDLEPPLPKKRKLDTLVSQSSNGLGISDLIQGEVARLPPRFKVNLDTNQASESDTLVLICQLDDEHLPCVPPITLILPPDYPTSPATFSLSEVEYSSTDYLKKVREIIMNRQFHLPEACTLTIILDTWEMSVRQACSDKPYIPDCVNPLLNLHSLWQ